MNPIVASLLIVSLFNICMKGAEEIVASTNRPKSTIKQKYIRPGPPIEIPRIQGFEYQAEQSHAEREKFFRDHILVNGEWYQKEKKR